MDLKQRRLRAGSFLLTFVLALCCAAWGAAAPVRAADEPLGVAGWADLMTAFANGGEIKLTSDVIAGENATCLVVPAGVTVTLDLNGYVIDRGLRDADTSDLEGVNGSVIEVYGTLTVTDSRPEFAGAEHEPRATVEYTDPITGETVAVSGGAITGGNGAGIAASCGVVVKGNGAFTLEKGAIVGNAVGVATEKDADKTGARIAMTDGEIAGNEAAAILLDGSAGKFKMSGGAIRGNTSSDTDKQYTVIVNKACTFQLSGEAKLSGNKPQKYVVYVESGVFTMSGGSIEENFGGGVYMAPAADELTSVFTMSAGSIKDNRATSSDSSAVHISTPNAQLNVSGSAKITGNRIGCTAAEKALPTGGTERNVVIYEKEGGTPDGFGIASGLSGAEIGVTLMKKQSGSYVPGGGVFANAAFGSNAACFKSDLADYIVVLNARGLLELMTPWNGLQTQLRAGGTVKLTRDYTAGESDEALTIIVEKTVELDLNGHTIDRGLTGKDAAANGCVIKVEGTLTLTDSSEGKTGRITGGNNSSSYKRSAFSTIDNSDGGGVFVCGGSFTMNGGSITGNRASSGGGVFVSMDGGSFTMNGGSITGNHASSGGGVFVSADMSSGGSFTMNGGSITGNYASGSGGGVLVSADVSGGSSSFTMTGGSITGNQASSGGGAYVTNGASFFVSGAPVITGNEAHNVFLSDNSSITVSDALGADAKLSVYKESVGVLAAGKDGRAITADEAKCFISELAGVTVEHVGGKVELTSPWSKLLSESGTVKLTQDCTAAAYDRSIVVPAGVTVTLDLNGHVLDRGLRNADASDLEGVNGSVIEVYGTLTVKDSRPGFTETAGEPRRNVTYTDPITGKTVAVRGGAITGGNGDVSSGPGGSVGSGVGVVVRGDGKLTLASGAIVGNAIGVATVRDSGKTGASITMTGGEIAGNAAAARLSSDSRGTFDMTGGAIRGNSNAEYIAKFGAGANTGITVSVEQSCTFKLSGDAELSGNKSSVVVFLFFGTFEMSGGSIRDNIGGSVGTYSTPAVSARAVFTMSGGSITGNRTVVARDRYDENIANAAAVGVDFSGGQMKVSGSARITGNLIVDEEGNPLSAINVLIYQENKSFHIDNGFTVVGALEGAEIGVTFVKRESNQFVPVGGVFTNVAEGCNLTSADAACFTSDLAGYAVVLNAEGKAELVDGVTFDSNGGTGKMAAQALPKGTALSPNTFTRTGYAFREWNTKPDGTGTKYADKASVTLNERTTLYAQWTFVPSLDGGTVTAPKGALLILASYDASGRLTATQTKTVDAACVQQQLSAFGLSIPSGSYKLMLVNGSTYAPLCEAWSKK